jgi:hypothetical protein
VARKKKKRSKPVEKAAARPKPGSGGRRSTKASKTAHESPAQTGAPAAWILRNLDYLAAACAAFIFVGHLFTTGDYLLGSGTDMVSHEYPTHAFALSWLKRGVLPLWNPYLLGGLPFQTEVYNYLYPARWTGLLFSPGFDIKVNTLVHLVVAATGGVFFVRGRTEHLLASFFGGVCFALSAFMVMHLFAGHRVMVDTAAYLPWVAGALERSVRGDRRLLLVGVVLTGLMMLAGHYHIVYVGMGGLLGFTVFETLFGERPTNTAAEQSASSGAIVRLRNSLFPVLIWGVFFAGGFAVAAVQLVPMFGTVELSQRSEGGLAFASSYSSAIANLLCFIFPNLFGNIVDAPFVGSWSFWESLGYLGLVPLVFIVVAVVALPWRRYAPALLVALGALALSMGTHTPLFRLYLSLVPAAELFRSPGRFTLLATLFGSLVAAQALDAWLREKIPVHRKKMVFFFLGACPLFALLVLLVVNTTDLEGFRAWMQEAAGGDKLGHLSEGSIAALFELGRSDALKALLLIGAASAGCAWGLRNRKHLRYLGVALVLMAFFDLHDFGRRFLATGSENRFRYSDDFVELLKRDAAPGVRAIAPAETRWTNFGAIVEIGTPGGYTGFIDSRWARYINRSQGRPLGKFFAFERVRRGSRLIRHLGIRYLLTTQPLRNGRNRYISGYDWFTPYDRIGRIYVYRDEDPVPRVALVHAVEIMAGEEDIYRKMEAPDFDIRKAVLLEAEPPDGFKPPERLASNAAEKARITLYTPNAVRIAVRAASRAVLVMSDNFQPGWSARVDGKPVTLLHANRVMRAIPIPAGEHTVTMSFMPTPFVTGAFISVFSICFWIATFVLTVRRPLRTSPERNKAGYDRTDKSRPVDQSG